MGTKSGILLKSEIEPLSDFNKDYYIMGLKSAHFQKSDFQESGEFDRFLGNGHQFPREIELS